MNTRSSALLLFLVAVVLYAPTLGYGFVFDDGMHVSGPEAVDRLEHPMDILIEPTKPGNLYRPLVGLSHWAVYSVFGLQPAFHHLANILLHGCVTLVLFLLLGRLFERRLAATTALLFAVHPVHLEAVANVAYRTELLCGLLLLSALYAALPLPRLEGQGPGPAPPLTRLRWTAVLLLALGAMMSKESAICLLLLLPLCLLQAHRFSSILLWWRQGLAAMAAPACAVGLYLAVRVQVLGGLLPPGEVVPFVDNPIGQLPAVERAVNALGLLGSYWIKVLAPHQLSADYSYAKLSAASTWLEPALLLRLALVLALPLFALAALRRRRLKLAFFVFWFYLAFAVTANLILPIGTIFAERLAYLPSVAGCGLMALLLGCISRPKLRLAATLGIALAGVLITASVLPAWRDDAALFARELKISGESVKVHINHSSHLRREGRLQQAEDHLRKALSIYPGSDPAMYNMGVVQMERKKYREAMPWFARTLERSPGHFHAALYLGKLRFNQRDIPGAESLLRRALQLRPASPAALFALLTIRLARGDLSGAMALRDRAARVAPNHPQLSRYNRLIAAMARRKGH